MDCAFGYCCERLYNRGPLPKFEKMWTCNECKLSIKEVEQKRLKRNALISS